MYQRILIATDGSEIASKAMVHGIALAKELKVPVTVVTVTGEWSGFELAVMSRQGVQDPLAHYQEMATVAASNILEKAAQIAKSQGVTSESVHVRNKYPAEGIVATAKDKGCDLIVMASHGYRGLDRLLLGSQANEVVTHSKVPVLIVR